MERATKNCNRAGGSSWETRRKETLRRYAESGTWNHIIGSIIILTDYILWYTSLFRRCFRLILPNGWKSSDVKLTGKCLHLHIRYINVYSRLILWYCKRQGDTRPMAPYMANRDSSGAARETWRNFCRTSAVSYTHLTLPTNREV